MKKYDISKDELIQKYINENYTIDECAEYFGCESRRPIEDRIKKYGIRKTPSHQTVMEMTNEMYEVLRGAMLGDGCLIMPKNGANAYFSYGSKSLQHVQFVSKYFDKYKSGKGIYSSKRYDERTNKFYQKSMFVTNRSVTLTNEREKWYIDNVKHIPNDLVLTPLMCLVWYIGDGSLSRNKKHNAQCITLATNCFEKNEIENILLPQLSRFDARIAKNGSGKDGKCHYQIKIYKKENVIAFLDYIGDCPFDDYMYKWDVKQSLLKNYSQYDNEWAELYRLNFATTKIGLLYGCDHCTVSRHLKAAGITIDNSKNYNKIPPVFDWEQLYYNGNTIEEIAKRFDCSVNIINRYFEYIKVNGNSKLSI